jgi:hypothetical protein
MGRLGESDHLGLVAGHLGESAELSEALDQPVSIVDGYWGRPAKILVNAFGRQRREVICGQLDRSLVLSPVVMHLQEIGRGENAEIPEVVETQ